MGGGQSKSTMKIDTKVLNETVSNFMIKNQTTQNQSGILIQEMNFENAKFLSCAPNFKQDGNITARAIQEFSAENTVDFKSMMKTAIENQIKKQANQSSGFGSMSIAEQKKDEMDIKSEIKNILTTNINMETLNTQVQNVSSTQKIESGETVFDPCGFGLFPNGPPKHAYKYCFKAGGPPECNMGQNMVIDLFAEQMSSSISKAIQSNTTINKIVKKVAMKSDQSTQGVGDSIGDAARGIGTGVGSIFGGMFGSFGSILGSLCFVALCIGAIGIYLKFGKGKKGKFRLSGNGAPFPPPFKPPPFPRF